MKASLNFVPLSSPGGCLMKENCKAEACSNSAQLTFALDPGRDRSWLALTSGRSLGPSHSISS